MRRFFLTLFIITSPGWSQPAQQPAQPPILVQVEMPPTNLWLRIVELVIPGLIGAGAALLAVSLTNKTNERTNAQTRQHQENLERIKDEIAAEAKSRDNQWAFRKDVYSGLVRTICNLLVSLNDALGINRLYLSWDKNNPHQMQAFLTALQDHYPRLREASTDFINFANLSHLATADWLVQRIAEVTPVLRQAEHEITSPDYAQSVEALMGKLNTLLKIIADAGRKDLWDAPEPRTKEPASK